MKSPQALPLPTISGTQHTLLFPYICLDHSETCFILQGNYHCDLIHYEIKILTGKALGKCFTDTVYYIFRKKTQKTDLKSSLATVEEKGLFL